MCKNPTNLEKEMKLALQSLELHQHYTHLPADTSTATRQLLRRGLEKRIKVQSTAAGRRPGISRGSCMEKTQPGRPPKDFLWKIDETEGSDNDDFDRFRFVSEKCQKLKKESMTSQITLRKISKIPESGDTKITSVISACPNCL